MNKTELRELYDLLCKFEAEYENNFGKIALTEINHVISFVSNLEDEAT